jgi:hypothetical protein
MIGFYAELHGAIAEVIEKHIPILPGRMDLTVKARFHDGEWHVELREVTVDAD